MTKHSSNSIQSQRTDKSMEDVGLADDGIVTVASHAIGIGTFQSATSDEATNTHHIPSVFESDQSTARSFAPETPGGASRPTVLSNDSSKDGRSGGLWSFQIIGYDDRSIPFDEGSFLRMMREGSNSVVYSECSEDPNDCHSPVDVEEAIMVRTKSKDSLPPQGTTGKPVPRFIQSTKSRSEGVSNEKNPPSGVFAEPPLQEERRPPRWAQSRKTQKRWTGIFMTLFVLVCLAAIGLGLVLVFFFLRDAKTHAPQQPAAETGNDYYIDITPNQTTEAPTLAPSYAPSISPTRSPVAAPTRSPLASAGLELTKLLGQNYSVDFPDDPSDPNNLAIAWLMEEADDHEMSLMELSKKLVQRFALVSLDLRWSVTTSIDDENRTTFATPWIDECDWTGVVCVDGTVTKLAWGSQNLVGRMPPEIGLLTNLRYLDLSQNQLQGDLPGNLYKLTSLGRLFLYQNDFTGTLSHRIASLKRLTHLHLSHNQFSGSIPLAMSSSDDFVRGYRYINLFSNNFSGPLTTGLRWRNVTFLDLGRNDFSGPLPEALDNLASIKHLHLDHNRFNGTIPGQLPVTAVSLSLEHNQLTGTFPANWDVALNITSLTVQMNNLTNRIPKDICDLSVFESGMMVEFKADCNVCACWEPFCTFC